MASPSAPPSPPKSPPPRSGGAPSTSAPTPKLGRLSADARPPRIVLNAVEGFGKTTFASFAPNPAIIMARGETGYATLLSAGSVPSVDATTVEDWPSLLALLDEMSSAATLPYQTIALDALGGFERLCHERVCARDFGNDWGEKGFAAYAKGFDLAITDWLQLLSRLDKLHARGTGIILLSHCQVKPYKNPMGPDYDRYASDVHAKTWAATHKWADAVLFGTFLTIVDKVRQDKGKGIGGTDRVVYTERRDAFDAKNRYGMPAMLDVPADPAQVYPSIINHITKKV